MGSTIQPVRRSSTTEAKVLGASPLLAAFLAAMALGLQPGLTALLAFVPAIAIVQVLPITVGGLGVREGAFALFLVPLGVPEEKALALGLLVYAINLGVSLLGAPAFAINRHPAPPPVAPVST